MNREAIQSIVDSGFVPPAETNLAAMTEELLPFLGATDALTRENTLEVLSHWIEAGRYTDQELRDIGERMAGNLAVGIGESGTDTVFLRSFSALILEIVVHVDQVWELGLMEGRSSFLKSEEVLRWSGSVFAAFAGERDFRGFVDGRGWAHALAHMSDLLGAFARSPHLHRAQLEQILTAVADKLTAPTDTVLLFEEDHRMIRGVVMHALLRDELTADFLHAWVEKLAHTADGKSWGSVLGLHQCDQDANRARVNVRSFLRSLYFVLTWGMSGSAPYPSQAGNAFSAYYDRPISAREALLADITAALRGMNRPLYKSEEAA